MKHTPKSIRDYMAQLGRRPKRMTPEAIAQRRAAGRAPRRRPPRDRPTVLAQSAAKRKSIPELTRP